MKVWMLAGALVVLAGCFGTEADHDVGEPDAGEPDAGSEPARPLVLESDNNEVEALKIAVATGTVKTEPAKSDAWLDDQQPRVLDLAYSEGAFSGSAHLDLKRPEERKAVYALSVNASGDSGSSVSAGFSGLTFNVGSDTAFTKAVLHIDCTASVAFTSKGSAILDVQSPDRSVKYCHAAATGAGSDPLAPASATVEAPADETGRRAVFSVSMKLVAVPTDLTNAPGTATGSATVTYRVELVP